jgi:hypothetical protein
LIHANRLWEELTNTLDECKTTVVQLNAIRQSGYTNLATRMRPVYTVGVINELSGECEFLVTLVTLVTLVALVTLASQR